MLGLGQGRAGLIEKNAPRLGQRDPAAAAFEQAHAQQVLQRTDLLAERRLRHAEILCRAPEMQLVGDGDEIAQMAKFHD